MNYKQIVRIGNDMWAKNSTPKLKNKIKKLLNKEVLVMIESDSTKKTLAIIRGTLTKSAEYEGSYVVGDIDSSMIHFKENQIRLVVEYPPKVRVAVK